jgi:exonuclease SbcC
MKITLKNFKCYPNITIDFGVSGIVLLSGASGTGKTSIIQGIYFALYGTGSKVVSHGKTSCSVTLEFDDTLTIVRTKRPNRLILNDIYEDDAAQHIINQRFGKAFEVTSYISQNAKDSFILMSPLEKLSFLEKIAFQDVDLTVIKKRNQCLIKERNETMIKTTSKLEMATNMLNEIKKPEKILFPIKCSIKNIEKAIKTEIIKSKNSVILVKKCKKKLLITKNELQSLQILNVKIVSLEDIINSIIEKLKNLSMENQKIEYIGDDKIQEYNNILYFIVSQRELISLHQRYNEDTERIKQIKEEEEKNNTDKIAKIKEKLWIEQSEIETNEIIKEHRLIKSDFNKIKELEKNLEKYIIDLHMVDQLEKYKVQLPNKKELLDNKKILLNKLLNQQEVYKCPSCNVNIRIKDNKLHIHDTNLIEKNEIVDIPILRKDISTLIKDISNMEGSIITNKNKQERYNDIKTDINNIKNSYDEKITYNDVIKELEHMENYKLTNIELSKNLSKLQDCEQSYTLISLKSSLKEQEKKINLIQQKSKNYNIKDYDEENIRKNIIIQKRNKELIETSEKNKQKLKKEQEEYQNQLEQYKKQHLDSYNNIRDLNEVIKEVKKYKNDLIELEKNKELYDINVKKIEQFQEYEKNIASYKSWFDKIIKLKSEENENGKQYTAATLLKEKILEAESIAMGNIIDCINTHTQVYLDCFFYDDPISIKLVSFKENKKGETKPQINIQIEYKGMNDIDINMLSGGELSRVILSFALALGEMFNTSVMLLDECTSSLDQESTCVVMDGMRENFSGNLILVIAHQVVKGTFDRVIEFPCK